MSSPPDSPLSELGSDDGNDSPAPLRSGHLDTPSSTRRRVSDASHDDAVHPTKRRRTYASTTDEPDPFDAHWDGVSIISEDSFGSAPGSPSHDEYTLRADQVTVCQWEGCTRGDLGNSDELINHVQAEHVGAKRTKYTCDWGDCARKGMNHPSGYALKAHMRSHTKEKPFFCALPECDRSFTRSDALAKHMRTVHEPEPPKASLTNANPIDPKTGQPVKGPKLRLHNGPSRPSLTHSDSSGSVPHPAMTAAQNPANSGLDPSDPNWDPSPPNDNIRYTPAHHPVTGQPGFLINYPPDIQFSSFESEIPADQLMRLLRRQIHWAGRESVELGIDIARLERLRRDEWQRKEQLLEAVMAAEVQMAGSRKLPGGEDGGDGIEEDGEGDMGFHEDVREELLRWDREPPWVAKKREADRTARHGGRSQPAEAARVRIKGEPDVAKAAPNGTAAEMEDVAMPLVRVTEAKPQEPRPSERQAADVLMGLGGGNGTS